MKVQESPLYGIATAAGLRPRALQARHGGLLVTVRGARVLGVFLDGSDENLLWVNRELSDVERAKRFVAAGEWNLGGDRCWLAPELELHFRDPQHPSHEHYAVPATIDPGDYVVRHEAAAGLVLQAGGEAMNLRARKPFTFDTRRAICLCSPPRAIDGVNYVGYELSSELHVPAPDRSEACYGLWQLMQIPPGGTVHVPLRRPPEIVDYFQTGVSSHCQVECGRAAFPVTGAAQHKLGLCAADVVGMMGYYRPGPGQTATLIVRQPAIFAGATYADYPAHEPQRRDIGLQLYNDSGLIGGFGEMEYHSTAATAANFFFTRDVSRTWCFGGPADRVRAVARELLGLAEVG